MPLQEDLSSLASKELRRRRLELLRARCPSCDRGYKWAVCTCDRLQTQVDDIERILIERGEAML